ncbi:MAG: hypothetical protein IPO24_04365 [Bacteroidetes bacterium]|nr:hypothetical protein [Bacteroidota bacterium]
MDVLTGTIDLPSTGVGGPYQIYYNVNAICPDASSIFHIDSADNNLAAFHFEEDTFVCMI